MTKRKKVTKYIELSPQKIYDGLCETVSGQEEAKRAISLLFYSHFLYLFPDYISNNHVDIHPPRQLGLIMGPTGTGKTMIIRRACEVLQELTGIPGLFPLCEVDCTSVTQRGWEGEDIGDYFNAHFKSNKGKILETSVIFLDEFDKLCKSHIGSKGTDHNKHTQYSLLKLIEGSEILYNTKKIDTRPYLFIMAGNFSEIRDAREQAAKPMGFTNDGTKVEKTLDNYYKELDKMGMATQLVGRITHIGETNHLGKYELLEILEHQILPQYDALWKCSGETLWITQDQKNAMVEQALKLKTGARGLVSEFNLMFQDEIFNLKCEIPGEEEEVEEIEIHPLPEEDINYE